MEKQVTSGRSHLALILVGFLAIAVSFFAYAKNNNLIITPAAMPALQNLAVATYLVLLASFAAIGWGLYKMYKTKITSADSSISSIIANAIHNKRSKQIFIISAIGYGLFFALTSGTIIYKPDINATDYGFPKPPHIELSPCCDFPGYMPMIFAFFTEHVGLQIIPLNLLLLVTVSFLVGLNFALSSTVFSIAKSGGKLGAFGAVTGLFVGCPTCAGTIFTMLFGFGAGATTFTLFLTSFEAQIQTIFIAISIPVLLVTPIIMAKKIKSQNESCAVKP
ncbi:hypothetical protein DYY66_0192 [Candidatus Nitrosotalea sp. FS]|uniref:hypothetical protein n=1 Tax=Candidatus Nitrosotalea sp. FS TaxID=2341021 RepID=UPI00140E447E|nr:hypothetical protein [Candidatus Nitrosotalea sp. FS]NHH98853.1 hypothetical protein [Candidatus Nitrosotalea sp. FS]